MKEGDVLAGKYRVDKVLGVGGMGVVVAAHHIQLDEKVALKFLLPDVLSSSEAVARFQREARAAVKIKSEHVARVSDVGQLENGSPYMVMEYLDGGDLAAWLQKRGVLEIEQAVEFVLQACEAIAEAHGLGIVHRDLKPANLFCVRRPGGELSIKVLDFGISKTTSLGGSGPEMGLTKTQALMGSPLYMSPEQMQSARNADARSDIWALGVILYELVTGRVPFGGEGLPELVLNVVSALPRPMRDLRPDMPPGLEAVVLRCLEKDRDRRYQNVAELAVALAEFGPKRARGSVERVSRVIHVAGLATTALTPLSDRAETMAGGTVGSWGQTQGVGGRKSAAVGAGLVAGIAIIGAIVIFALRPSNDAPSPAALVPAPVTASEPVSITVPVAVPTPASATISTPSAAPAAPIPPRSSPAKRPSGVAKIPPPPPATPVQPPPPVQPAPTGATAPTPAEKYDPRGHL